MKFLDTKVTAYEHSFRIYPIGDLHLTLKGFNERKFKAYQQAIANDPAAIAFVMGDVSDARDRKHKFFDPGSINPRFAIDEVDILEDKILDYAVELMAPIKDKIRGVLRGNHHSPGFTRRLVRELELGEKADLGDRAMARVFMDSANKREGSRTIKLFMQHYDSGGRKPGAQINSQLETIISFDADIYLFAHSHRVTEYVQPRWSLPDRGKLHPIQEEKILLNAGSFVDSPLGFNAYPDGKGLPLQNISLRYVECSRVWNASRNVYEVRCQTRNWGSQ